MGVHQQTKWQSLAIRYPELTADERKRLKAQFSAFYVTVGRCYCATNKDYPYYGGRGITVCPEWLADNDNFYKDMGLRPEGLTLDRIDNNGPYNKDNCRWSTRKEQTANRENSLVISYKGETKTVEEWSRLKGIPYGTLKARVTRLGYSADDAIEKPVKCGIMLDGSVSKHQRAGHGLSGIDHPSTAFNSEQITDIRRNSTAGQTNVSLAQEYNVCMETISSVVNRKGAYSDC